MPRGAPFCLPSIPAAVVRGGWRAPAALAIPATVVLGGRFARQVVGSAGVGGAQRVACPVGRRGGGCWRYPKGGLPGWSPANLAFGFLSPIPPPALAERSSPPGKGDIKVIFMQGASPLASPRAEPMVRRITERKRFPASGAARVQPPGTCMARLARAASGLMPGCRGRSPRRNKLWISPFPAGEGGRGDRGQKGKLTAGASRRQRKHAIPWAPLRQTHHTGGRGARPGKNSPPRAEKSRNPIDFCPAAWYHIYKDSPDNLHEYIAEAPKKKGRNDNALSKKTVS